MTEQDEKTLPPRIFKVYQRRDQHRGKRGKIGNLRTTPEIRLPNRWLERAGFKAGDRFWVTVPHPGIIVLRRIPDLALEAVRLRAGDGAALDPKKTV